MSSAILTAALAYAAHGLAVLPISRSKHPVTENGTRDASTDESSIRVWWRKFPNASVAIACGPHSRVFALDVDGPEGRASLAALVEQHSQLPRAPANSTTRGYHLIFAWPTDGRQPRSRCGNVRLGLGTGLDVRADGCCFTAPPSMHLSGRRYRWAAGRSIFEIAPPAAPEWLLELACKVPEVERPAVAPQTPIDGEWGPCPAYSRMALDRAAREIAGAPPGRQEFTLNSEAYSIGQLVAGGVMPSRFARDVLIWAGCKMVNGDPRRPWHRNDVQTKVDRAFADALRSPCTIPERAA
jgi:Bifunctional DNA primase/polymerase, N-terminal